MDFLKNTRRTIREYRYLGNYILQQTFLPFHAHFPIKFLIFILHLNAPVILNYDSHLIFVLKLKKI